MLRNYLTTALRTLRRRPGFTALNITGLALGLACCLSIGLYVQHELSYDQHHAEADRIVRVVQNTDGDGTAWVGGAMAPLLAEDFPQIEETVRFHRTNTPVRRPGTEQIVEERNFIYADSSAFDVFDFPLVQGAPETALARPGTVVLTEEAATRHFGDEDPMGQTLLADGRELTVTGVMADLPATTHMAIDMMTSLATFKLNVWGNADGRFTKLLVAAHVHVRAAGRGRLSGRPCRAASGVHSAPPRPESRGRVRPRPAAAHRHPPARRPVRRLDPRR